MIKPYKSIKIYVLTATKEAFILGKMNLSQDDIEKIIKWLEYADRHVELNRDIDEMHGNTDKIDDYIQEHYQIDYLITKLKCK